MRWARAAFLVPQQVLSRLADGVTNQVKNDGHVVTECQPLTRLPHFNVLDRPLRAGESVVNVVRLDQLALQKKGGALLGPLGLFKVLVVRAQQAER